jgi:hypothetical protein
MLDQSLTLSLVLPVFFNLLPGSRAIFISHPDNLMNSLVNLFSVCGSNDYTSLIKDAF